MTLTDTLKAKELLEGAGWDVTDFGEYIQISLGIVTELVMYKGDYIVRTDENYLIKLTKV